MLISVCRGGACCAGRAQKARAWVIGFADLLGGVQAAKVADLLDKRWREREKQYTEETGATSLPPLFFVLREPDGLSGSQKKIPRYR